MKAATERMYSQSAYGIRYDRLKYHSLHHAVHDARIPQIQLLLKIHPELVNIRTDLGLTPLMIACCLPHSRQKDRIVKTLTKAAKLNPYETDHCKRSAIFYFVNFSTLSLLKDFLRDSHFNYVDETDNDGYSILHYAAVKEDLEILEFVIDLFKSYRVNINLTNDMNYSALLLACRLKKYRSVAILIKMGATGFNVRDNEHFRSCLDWVEFEQDSDSVVDPFYFSHFDINLGNCFESLMKMGIQSVGQRHIDCFSFGDRQHTFVVSDAAGEMKPMTERFERAKSFYSQKSDMRSSSDSRSVQLQDVESMTTEEAKEFVIDSLKGGNKKINRPKRVSIVLRDKVYHTRKSIDSSVSTNILPYFRESSALIAHRLLRKVPMDYFD